MPLSLTAVFADLPDRRRDTKNKVHRLTDILTIATCAVLAGAEGWDEIAEYGQLKADFFRRFLELPSGIPSHDTFNRVFAKLAPEAFADRFGRWMAGACEATGLVQVPIDGEPARRSPKGTFAGCPHLVEAWAVESRLVLGPRSVPEGGHEVTTIPDLLATLGLKGALVTIDAAFCQEAIVEQIRAEYMVTVKGNQAGSRDAVADVFGRAGEAGSAGCDMSAAVEDGHGRHEERYVSVITDPTGSFSVARRSASSSYPYRSDRARHECARARRYAMSLSRSGGSGHGGSANGLTRGSVGSADGSADVGATMTSPQKCGGAV